MEALTILILLYSDCLFNMFKKGKERGSPCFEGFRSVVDCLLLLLCASFVQFSRKLDKVRFVLVTTVIQNVVPLKGFNDVLFPRRNQKEES